MWINRPTENAFMQLYIIYQTPPQPPCSGWRDSFALSLIIKKKESKNFFRLGESARFVRGLFILFIARDLMSTVVFLRFIPFLNLLCRCGEKFFFFLNVKQKNLLKNTNDSTHTKKRRIIATWQADMFEKMMLFNWLFLLEPRLMET